MILGKFEAQTTGRRGVERVWGDSIQRMSIEYLEKYYHTKVE
jgi:hypothetical protein